MNSLSHGSDPRMGAAQYVGLALILAATQAGLILVLGRWPTLPSHHPSPRQYSARLLPADLGEQSKDPLEGDPRLFAHPDHHGFSHLAEQALPAPGYRFAEWRSDPRWLTISDGTLPPLHEIPLREASPPPPWILTSSTPQGTPRLLADQTRAMLQGGLVGREILSTSPLPTVSAPDILAASVIELMVFPSGDVVSARLISTSGSREADSDAMRWARSLRFKPEVPRGGNDRFDPSSWSTGDLMVVWNPPPARP